MTCPPGATPAPPNARPLVELRGVSRAFTGADGGELTVLRNINLELHPGESLAVVGASGSGKSTLLNIMGTLDRPTAGQALLEGEDIAKLDETALARLRNRSIGFVFQLHHLLPQCTVYENVLVPTLVGARETRREPAAERARRLLERVGLSERLGHRPAQLSGGERQRVAVVRALINEPHLLLADEPTGALDRAAAEQMATLLSELNREEGVTLVVVTHSLALARRMGRVLELREGSLAAPGSLL
jgi:lipoprotein-releasing system ATP-binding protein